MVRLFFFLLLLVLCPYDAAVVSAGRYGPPGASCYKRLFSLGDSTTDTGNLASVAPNSSVLAFPYGETFFHRPTGRFCDGRLIVDFIAEALKLPFVTPFLTGKTAADFRHGANFAVSGATALGQQFFRDMGLDLAILPPFSLDVQLGWFERVLHLLGPTEKERQDIMSSSLFLLGEIGINDYNYPFLQNRSFADEIRPLLPKVIDKIENATKSDDPGTYDAAGCIRWLNEFAEEHNRALRRMLRRVPRSPAVAVVYADYYAAVQEITRDPLKHGFRKDAALTACCGDGGPHNSGVLISCNATSVLCPDPSEHISWDGVHLTEAAYRFVARGVLDGPYAAPPILSTCAC
ncbi:GDSL esterase/lipase [Panicum miliaceum]|uniref:GDSL esterase/lipase n=1 Tax=Panicum miliaceum TaxID=4540 RepID=A0A3L6TTX4_PANMI|nr:GDSL esterase/lipase [Panicum miliaceum]